MLNLKDTVVRVIDCETTGLDPATEAVVEVAFADVDLATGSVIKQYSTLINPGRPIPPEASAIHHIVDSDVKDAPRYNDIHASLFAPVYAAHNAAFDSSFLLLPGDWICTHRLSRHLWPEFKSHSNQNMRYALGIQDVPGLSKDASAHRALADCLVTAAVLPLALERAAAAWPEAKTVAELLAKAREPAELVWAPFKSKAGMKFSSLDDGFLRWVITKGAGGEDAVHTARLTLRRRTGAVA